MARKSTIRLLLVNESDNETERLVSLFRNAGRVARAQRVASAEALETALKNEQWDLLIANDKHPEIQPQQCLEHLRSLQPELPALIVHSEGDTDALFAAGARDVLAPEEEQRLVHAAARELSQLEQRRELTALREQLAEAEHRNKLLMSEAQDAIAFVADGMVINANNLFAQRFGYESADELDCLPVIDLIAAKDQDRFKSMLKAQAGGEDTPSEFDFSGRQQDGDEFSANIQLSGAKYEGEPCVQLVVRDTGSAPAAAPGGASSDIDPQTGLHSRDYFLRQLDSVIKHSGQGGSLALLINIDNFGDVRRNLGLSGSGRALADLGAFLQPLCESGEHFSRYCDDAYALLLSDTSSEKALALAEELCKKTEEHIIDIDGQSFQCTITVGLRAIEGLGEEDAAAVMDQAFAACQQQREESDNHGVGNGASLYVPTKEKRTLASADSDSALDEALEDERFRLLFQPIISLRGASGDHYEVLLRLLNDQDEEVDPNPFLESLGDNAVGTKLDRWIILEATKLLADHRAQDNDTRLLINLTHHALQDETLLPWLGVALKAGGLPAEAVVLQFREEDVVNYLKAAKKFAADVGGLGCKMAISEFGGVKDPGKVLKNVPAHYIKLAGRYSRDMQNNEGDPNALKELVAAVAEHSMQSVVPLVENAAALASLWQIGVDFIQGDYLSPPAHEMNYEFTDIA